MPEHFIKPTPIYRVEYRGTVVANASRAKDALAMVRPGGDWKITYVLIDDNSRKSVSERKVAWP